MALRLICSPALWKTSKYCTIFIRHHQQATIENYSCCWHLILWIIHERVKLVDKIADPILFCDFSLFSFLHRTVGYICSYSGIQNIKCKTLVDYICTELVMVKYFFWKKNRKTFGMLRLHLLHISITLLV